MSCMFGGTSKVLCNNNTCKICKEMSFASHEKSKYWSKRNTVSPRDVKKTGHSKYYFICNVCNHELLVSLSQISRGQWCSYCTNRKLCDNEDCKICFDKSVASCDSIIVNRWSIKNDLSPRQVFKNSTTKMYFMCDVCNHETYAKVHKFVTSKMKCFYCSSKRICGRKDCEFCIPKTCQSYEARVINCWSDKNELKPYQIFKNSEINILFECNVCKHEFTTFPGRIKQNNWCPYCANKQLCDDEKCEFCFAHSFASCSKSKYWSIKNKTSARNIQRNDYDKYYFTCNKCKHDFLARTYDINNGSWCLYCSNKLLCDNEDCKICFDKSAASYGEKIIKMWSDKNEITPRKAFKFGDIKFWFKCNVCNHEFDNTVYNSMALIKSCPYCTDKKICGKESCKMCFKKSFASQEHDKVECWSNKNKVKPFQVFKCSQKEYWFDCKICNHTFKTVLGNIVATGQWCSYCTSKFLCNNNKCQFCFEKSFASCEKCKFLVDEINPRQIFKHTQNKYTFECNKCKKEFKKRISDISNGSWCPFCKRKSESIIFDWLSENYSIEREKKFEWCKLKHKLPFDFYIDKCKIIIELDGIQHMMQRSNWEPPEETQRRDIFKMKKAMEHGLSIVRIYQPDVLKNKINWKQELLNKIKKYDTPNVIYIESSNVYNIYMKKLI